MNRDWPLAVLALALSSLSAQAGMPEFEQQMAVQESLRQMPRWEQVRWLAKRGLPDPYLRDCTPTQDSGLRCVGRWSYGPSTWVDIRATTDDTIVFLSRGSGVSVIRFRSQDSLGLDLLSDINSHGLTGRCQFRDTLLCVNSGGVECYDISDLGNPVLLNWLSQPLMYDFFVVDTLLYTSSRDSFRVFSVANPASPRWLGACADSGFVMYVSGTHAYLGHQAGLFILDVANPAAPHRVHSLGVGAQSVWVRDTMLFVGTYDSTLRVYNVGDPISPVPVGSLDGIAPVCLYQPPTCDTVIYSPALDIISVSNPALPHLLGSTSLPGWEYGVAVVPALNCALVADHFEGLIAVNISNPATPIMASQQYAADLASDICVQGNLAYVADLLAGMRILDISDPTRPATLGGIDSLFSGVRCPSIAVKDSFAFMGMYRPWFRSVNVSDPVRPTMAGACSIPTEPQDMVLRDSFVYAALNYQFNVVDVARPRQPQVVGTLSLPDYSYGICLRDTLAYVGTYPLEIISIASPTAPRVVGSIPRAGNVDVQDTIAYVAGGNGLFAYSVADPAAPYEIDSLGLNSNTFDVAVVDTLAFVGTRTALFLVNVANPRDPIIVGQHPLPSTGWRVEYAAPYVYVAVQDAGVCIFETMAVAVEEPKPPAAQRQKPAPTVVRGAGWMNLPEPGIVMDAAGRRVAEVGPGRARPRLAPGVYFVREAQAQAQAQARTVRKIVVLK